MSFFLCILFFLYNCWCKLFLIVLVSHLRLSHLIHMKWYQRSFLLTPNPSIYLFFPSTLLLICSLTSFNTHQMVFHSLHLIPLTFWFFPSTLILICSFPPSHMPPFFMLPHHPCILLISISFSLNFLFIPLLPLQFTYFLTP